MWYALLLLGTLLEGEVSMLIACWGAHTGVLQPISLAAVASLGAWIGDALAFELGRRRGHAILDARPKWRAHTEKMQRWMARYPALCLLLLRWQIGLRIVGNAVLGMSPLSRIHYLALNAVACVLWAAGVTAVGLYFARFLEWFREAMGW